MAKTKAEKIASIEMQMAQLENQRKKLIQEQREQTRKDRTKRLCKRMGLFESMLPDTITLTDEQFQNFLEQTVCAEHSRRILERMTEQNAATAAPIRAGAAAQPPTNPASTEPQDGADGDGDEGNGARVTG